MQPWWAKETFKNITKSYKLQTLKGSVFVYSYKGLDSYID